MKDAVQSALHVARRELRAAQKRESDAHQQAAAASEREEAAVAKRQVRTTALCCGACGSQGYRHGQPGMRKSCSRGPASLHMLRNVAAIAVMFLFLPSTAAVDETRGQS